MGGNSLDRNAGNPTNRPDDREGARVGVPRKPAEIPRQANGARNSAPVVTASPGSFRPSTLETGGRYSLGPGRRPNLSHDPGFSIFPKRKPEAADYAYYAKWSAMLEGAEALRPDLTDGIAAYRYFLNGKGKPRTFSYERYIAGDASGRITLNNAILDFQYAATELALNNLQLHTLQISGPGIRCGADPKTSPYNAVQFPYPATENWQKAIGAHWIWLSGTVSVTTDPTSGRATAFAAQMELHAEDRYNFNPGDADIASGVEDSENGRFEVSGLAHAYESYATMRRSFEWRATQLSSTLTAGSSNSWNRQPDNNRRLRNRM